MEFWKLPQTQAWAILLGMALLPNGSTVHVGQTSTTPRQDGLSLEMSPGTV